MIIIKSEQRRERRENRKETLLLILKIEFIGRLEQIKIGKSELLKKLNDRIYPKYHRIGNMHELGRVTTLMKDFYIFKNFESVFNSYFLIRKVNKKQN